MSAQTAYMFLKPSLEQLSEQEKEELCRLISGEQEPKPANRKRARLKDPVMSKVEMKKKLLKSHFKSKTYTK